MYFLHFIFSGLISCNAEEAGTCMWVQVPGVWTPESVYVKCLPQSLHLDFEAGSLTEPGARLAGQQIPVTLLALPLELGDYSMSFGAQLFHMGSGVSNSSPHDSGRVLWGQPSQPGSVDCLSSCFLFLMEQ